jgi:hypothetical protein
MPMRPMRTVTIALATLLAAICAPIATAETVHVKDPAGDGQDGRIFDITSIRIENGDFEVATRISFRRVIAPADLYVVYLVRGGHGQVGAIVHSKLRLRGIINDMRDNDGAIACKRLSAEWNAQVDEVRLSFPSRCLAHGNYGAFRVQLIVERGGGSDSDFAPKDDDGNWRWTRWISRG